MKRLTKKYVIPHEGNEFRPHLLRATGVLFMLVFILGALFASNVYRVFLKTSDFIASVLPAVLVDLANADRSAYSLGGLALNPELQEAARLKAEDMAAKAYFAHTSPEGVSPWYWFSEAGYRFVNAGENLAIYFDDSAAVNAAWMNSPGHRANILNTRFTQIGVATARGVYQGQETLFVVQMFGSPAPATAALAKVPTASKSPGPPGAVAKPGAASVVSKPSAPVVVASSSVLSESSSEMFVAVQNAAALATQTPPLFSASAAPRYASLFTRFISSPTKLLALVYTLVSVFLLLVLLSVLLVRHEKRGRHMLVILTLLLTLIGLYYAYRAFAVSEVMLAPTSSVTAQ